MNPIIRSDGSPKFAMISTLAGAAVNIILDPIFIFIFKWGMMGAAAATVIGQVLTAVLTIWYLCHMKAVTLNKNSFTIQPKLTLRFLSLGICSFLSQISLVAAMAAINNMITKYGALDPIFSQAQYAQIPMAVVGIVMKFFQIVISIAVGMAAGCIPIIGYNIGAGRQDRARSLFTHLLIWEAIVGAVALLIAECFPHQLLNNITTRKQKHSLPTVISLENVPTAIPKALTATNAKNAEPHFLLRILSTRKVLSAAANR